MNIRFKKVHGSNNDFILIDETKHNLSFNDKIRSNLAQLLCNRQTAIGADGILYVRTDVEKDGRMQIFNADGSEASMCGNGLRAAGRYICEQVGKDEIIVETMKANLYVKKDEEIFPNIPSYRVEISPVSFQLKDLPVTDEREQIINEKIELLSNDLTFTCVAVPNPHLISIVQKEQLMSDEQTRISEYVNGNNPLFPDGVNVSFVYLMDQGEIFVRTYERGVGYTNACGTAMSASSLVVALNGYYDFEKRLKVFNPGGFVHTIVHRNEHGYSIDLIGNATYVFDGEVDVHLESETINQYNKIITYTDEINQYSEMEKFAKSKLSFLF